MPVRAVLFDLDDTLYDHTEASRRSTAEAITVEPALAVAGLEMVQAENLRLLEVLHVDVAAGRTSVADARAERWRRVLTTFGGNPRNAYALAERARTAYRACEGPVPGAVELLDRLRSVGVLLGIVSNNDGAEQRGKLLRLGLAARFATAAFSADHGVAKPDPRLFHVALAGLQLEPECAVHVGDSWETDVLGARAAGIRPVWFNRSCRPCGDASAVRQVIDFRHLDEATQAILGDVQGR